MIPERGHHARRRGGGPPRGTPQCGPLSPLLANVLLDEVARELEGRGDRFVRYADDSDVCIISTSW